MRVVRVDVWRLSLSRDFGMFGGAGFGSGGDEYVEQGVSLVSGSQLVEREVPDCDGDGWV